MSCFFGVFASAGGVPGPCKEALEAAAAKLPPDFSVSRFSDDRLDLTHVDLRVLPETGFRTTPEGVAAVAGAFLFGSASQPAGDPLQPELSCALRALTRGRLTKLREANGTFVVCAYDRSSARLTLATDSLGARPLYYAQRDDLLFFSTSQRVLSRIATFPLVADLAAYAEQEAVCYPLGPRTLYRNVRVLVAGEALTADAHSFRTSLYHHWSEVRPEKASVEDHAQNCFDTFRRAVRDRVPQGRTCQALLSGGLDSRLICAELLAQGHAVEAWNLTPEGYQDQIYARAFAAKAGIALHALPWRDLPAMSAGEATAMMLTAAVSQVAPSVVFSGDGGGETFGFLLIDPKAANLLHHGMWDAGIQQYLKKARPSRRLYTDAVYRELETAVVDRMTEEMRSIGAASDKTLQIFALTNDLRCHLHQYFSDISESRVELLLPFYDRRVIEAILRVPSPLGPLLGHRFYHRILQFASPLVFSVPWQTCPGHEPCPVQAGEEAPPNQWSRPSRVGDMLAKRCLKLLLSRQLSRALRPATVAAACMLHLLRRADYTYLFKTCLNVSDLAGPHQSWIARDHCPLTRSALPAKEEAAR
jgi:asparagine synthase (glutamine-hydrolysing)